MSSVLCLSAQPDSQVASQCRSLATILRTDSQVYCDVNTTRPSRDHSESVDDLICSRVWLRLAEGGRAVTEV